MKDINATIIIDIEGKNEKELLMSFDYSRRKNINKAINSGLKIEIGGSEIDYEECYNLYSKIILEGGSTPFTYSVWRDWAKEENWDLFVIKKDGKSIGYFSIIKIDQTYYGLEPGKKGVRPRVFASDKEYDELRINDLIYWGTILEGLKQGVSFVDLGGYQLNPRGHLKGVNSFKEKWGGKIFYYYLDYPFPIAIARKIIRNSGLFWKFNEKLKKKGPKKPPVFKIK